MSPQKQPTSKTKNGNLASALKYGRTKSPKEIEMLNEEENNNNNNSNDNNNCSNEKSSTDTYIMDTTTATNTPRPYSRSSSSSTAYESEELESSRYSPASSREHQDQSKSDRSSPTGSSEAEDLSALSHNSSPEPQLDNELGSEQVQTGGGKQLNVHSNLVPATQQANELIDLVRKKFLETIGDKSAATLADIYDISDLEQLKLELPEAENQEQSLAVRLIARFFHLSQLDKSTTKVGDDDDESAQLSDKELDEIVEKLNDLLQFRRHFQVPSIRADQFCQEFYLLHGIFPFGYDRQRLPVLYLRANVHRRWSHKLDESFRRYCVWQVNMLTKSYEGAKIQKSIGLNGIEKDGSFGICFDCIHVSYSCVDMDFLRFLVKLLVNYYPTYCRYALCVDLPWLFRSVWKLVRSWLPEDAQNTVQLITSKQLVEYIAEDQIPNSIRISDDEQDASEKRKHKLPDNFKSLKKFEDIAQELKLSSSEVKSFKAHIEKVLKEYRRSGAI